MDEKQSKDYLMKFRVTTDGRSNDDVIDALIEFQKLVSALQDADIEASQYKDAKKVINYIRSL